MPLANSHSTWALASPGGYLWQIANFRRRYATPCHITGRAIIFRIGSPATVEQETRLYLVAARTFVAHRLEHTQQRLPQVQIC